MPKLSKERGILRAFSIMRQYKSTNALTLLVTGVIEPVPEVQKPRRLQRLQISSAVMIGQMPNPIGFRNKSPIANVLDSSR